ncbi:VWA domain-containing protein [Acidicapsa acidisoli]|uniref:VWA domain-containing protein n=1 Tax=Acidicapsa acidisoli TaxID=1615681 RepID=UPI0021E07250|nr:VWA domain-containing protein [Acidicapsa acidisoli]
MRLLASMLVLATLPAVAQVTGQNVQSNANGTYTITTGTQLVVETVIVKDKKGNSIDGLTAKDFTVTEDGVTQTIRFCEHQELPQTPNPLPVTPADKEDITIYKRLANSQIASEKQSNVKYKDRRLLALYFDMTAMPAADQMRALAAAQKFIRTQMTSSDLIALLRYQGGSVDVLQDFTDDRNRLLSVIETLVVGEGQEFAEAADDASASDTGAAFGQDDSEFNVFNTDRQLSALQTAAKMLSFLNERKSLIYFASGLRLNGVDNQAQLHATIDAAIRAGVSFWPIDARGLVAEAPLGDATQGSPGNIGMYSGTAAQAITANFQQSQDTLYALAGDTGGKALFDNNDLTRGIVQAQQAVSNYYILGYYTTNPTQDGRFRRIKISVSPELGAALDYRQGYYADKQFNKFTSVDKERQLEDALMLGDPITELTISIEINYFQLNRAEYFVPIVVKIPGRELALAKRGGAEHTLIDFIGEIKDNYGGTTVTNLRDNVNIKLSDATALELAKRPIEYDAGFTLLPGKYTIKFLARDDETGRIGTYQTTFTIPNLNKELKRVPISSVVLSSQRVDLKDALYNAVKAKDQGKEAAVNPLVQNGQKLIPSVTRVFSRSRDLLVYLQAYEGAAGAQPLAAYVTFLNAQTKVYESQPILVTPQPDSRLGMTPLTFSIPLKSLAPGEYDCQVTVLDPSGQKGTFWEAPIKIVP